VLALLLYARFGLTADFFVLSFFTAALIVITFIDFDHQIIPDRISIPGVPIGFAASLFFLSTTTWIDSLIGIVAGGCFLLLIALAYSLITGKEGMGGGDIKFLAMIGAFTGWEGIIFVVFISSLVGSLAGILYIVFSGRGSRSPIPFGPFLALSAYVYFLAGEELINLYLVRL
jgi:leader peptidase (prepilin peptidase)/N-methyltransferase